MSMRRGVSSIVVLTVALQACSAADHEEAAPLSGVTAVSAGFDSNCALIEDGSVRCWGSNYSGQLGNGDLGETPPDSFTAVPVRYVANAVGVSVGQDHACAALADGSVKCWGQLPGPWLTERPSQPALPVDAVTAAHTLAAGRNHTCALLTDATVQCWGNGSLVPLGDGSPPSAPPSPWSSAVAVAELRDVTAIAVSSPAGSCALLESGEVKCWGDTWVDGDTLADESLAGRIWLTYTPTPRVVEGLPSAAGISLAHLYSCAVLKDTTVACWGLIRETMGGTGRPTVVPLAVADLSDVVAVSTGDSHACALLSDRSIRCWGLNSAGQLGDGSDVSSAVPVRVQGIDSAIAISAGRYRTCALLADGTVSCWGNGAGGCSNGLCSHAYVPLVVRVSP